MAKHVRITDSARENFMPTMDTPDAAGYIHLTDGTNVLSVYPTGALKVTDTTDGPVEPGTAAANSQLAGAVYNSGGITMFNAQQSAMQMDNTGNLKVTVSGAILANPVAGASVLSTVNSSSTPLSGNATFTGSGELCIDYASIVIQVYSSHASASGGLQVQFSTNNTNWDKAVVYTVSATQPENYIEFPRARYMRIVYTNGATLQTSFRLQTIFHYSPVNSRHTTLDAELNAHETCVLGRHAIVGFDPTTNAPYNAKVNSSGQLLVATAGAAGPSNTEATESVAKRSYQTTITILLHTTNEYAMILFNNPTGSGKTVYIRNITFANTTGANKSVTLKVYADPTVTVAGTPLTATTMYVGSNAPSTATTVTYNNIGLQGNNNVTQTMTVTNFGTNLSTMVATNETSNIDYNWGLLVSPNHKILITALAAANNQNTTINIIWTEV
jgi:hypothetical protein